MTTRTSHLALVALLSLTAGILIGGFVVGGLSGVLAGTTSLSPTEPVEPETRARSAEQAVEPRSASVAVPSALRAPADPRAVTRAPERPLAPLPDVATASAGADRLGGSIVTLDGRPLADVELVLEPPSDAPKYRARRATSDAAGRFEFTGLPQGVWELEGRHPDYVLQRRTSFPTRVPTGAEVEFLACPGISVEVQVVGPGAQDARVAYRRLAEREPRWSEWSAASPRLALRPGAWELCASVGALDDWPSDRGWKLAPFASQVSTVHVGAEEAQQVILELGNVNCLHGTVRLPAGHQADNRPRLSLIEVLDGTRTDFESPGDRTLRSVNVDEQGRYGVFDLPYERWTAGVGLRWGTPPVAEVVEVLGLTRIDFDQSDLGGEGSVVVDAFSPAGQRITEGLALMLLHRDARDEPDDYVWQPSRTALESGGSLRVVALPMDPETAEQAARKEEFLLRAAMPGFAQIDFPLTELNGERFELRFTSSAELEVALVGEGALRAMRKCNGSLKGEQLQAWTEFDEASGALKFSGLHPGRYTLTLVSWLDFAGGWRQECLHQSEVEVRAGVQHLEIPMPARADLVVRCPGVKQDVRANLFGPLPDDPSQDRDKDWQGTWARAEVDETGLARFEDMLTGTYRLTIGNRMQIVRVPGPAVDFEGSLPDRYRFRLPTGGSPLRRAGVRSGDSYVGIDGEELSKDAGLERLTALSSQSSGTLRLTVERLDRRLDITLDAADLGEDESFSLPLEPVLE